MNGERRELVIRMAVGSMFALACAHGEPVRSRPVAANLSAATSQSTARPTEAALRLLIGGLVANDPEYDQLSREVADDLRLRRRERDEVARWGALRRVVYLGSGPQPGVDAFDVTLEHGFSEWHVGLAADGTIDNLFFRIKAQPPERPLSEEEFIEQLKVRLSEAVAADEFAGAVSIRRNGQTLFERAHGLADRERHIPNAIDTKFRIGSVSKAFTTVAILQLAEAHRLSLDDTVGQHMPWYPNASVASKVTIEDLLLHMGGTGDIFGPVYEARRLELNSLEDYVEIYGARAPEFDPGTRVEYSNYGFVLLGLVVTAASGQGYYDYVREHIFEPAGMRRTESPPEREPVEGRSHGYMWTPEGTLIDNDDTLPPRATSAGGGLTTVGDLQRFGKALLDGVLLSRESYELLTGGRVNAKGERREGALPLAEFRGHRLFGHGGAAPGMSASLSVLPDSGHVVTVLSNLDLAAAQRIHEYIMVRMPL